MIKQLSTILLIVAAMFATPAFAQTYNYETEFNGTFMATNSGSNQGSTTSTYTLKNLISGDALLFSSLLEAKTNWSIDMVTGYSSCSGICSTVETLLNGDKIYSSFIDTSYFDSITQTVNFSGTAKITGGTGLFANATGSSTYSGFHQYLTATTGVSFQRVVGSITTPSVSGVPEPETYGMMMAGLGLIGFATRRKQKAAV